MTDLLLAGTDETSIDVQIDAYEALSKEAKDAISRIDVHAYQGSRRTELQAVSKRDKKGLWMSEVDGSDVLGEDAGEIETGLCLAKEILTDIKELTLQHGIYGELSIRIFRIILTIYQKDFVKNRKKDIIIRHMYS
ncbi:hypothetical protein [Anaerosporobacter faecicola]|uniref:hypothetical protein n=1 Tax=Anaerosporobacter faecicola TaxID=2718714 RepID=UPI00143AE165|nr:hypothetical protein [Anaerosporobacter faecicola]